MIENNMERNTPFYKHLLIWVAISIIVSFGLWLFIYHFASSFFWLVPFIFLGLSAISVLIAFITYSNDIRMPNPLPDLDSNSGDIEFMDMGNKSIPIRPFFDDENNHESKEL